MVSLVRRICLTVAEVLERNLPAAETPSLRRILSAKLKQYPEDLQSDVGTLKRFITSERRTWSDFNVTCGWGANAFLFYIFGTFIGKGTSGKIKIEDEKH